MTIGIFCPTDGEASTTIRTLRKFIEIFKTKNFKIKVILAGSNGHYSNELDKLNIDYATLHANPWIFPAYSKDFSSSDHTEETFKHTVPIAKKLAEWNVDVILSISMLSNSGAVASTLINKPHIWFVNEDLTDNPKYKGYFEYQHYKNLIESSSGLIFDNFKNFFNSVDSKYSHNFVFKRLESFTENIELKQPPKVDIVLPFYNDKNIFECIDKVKQYKISSLENVFIILDQGPDEELNNKVRSKFKNDNLVTIIENKVNSGFVRSCNVGIQASKNDVILLNTDTIPGPFWLENLQKAVYSDSKIMTASPLSNSIEDLSIPCIKGKQDIDVELISNILNKFVSQNRIEVHSAHGFCMYIKRECINKVGILNEEEFGKGYGEENEFSLRVREKGFINILAGNSFVKHLGSRSFTSEAKLALKKKNSTLLKQRYPYMIPEFLDFIRVNPLAEISNIVKLFSDNPELLNREFVLLSSDLRNSFRLSEVIDQMHLNKEKDILFVEGPYTKEIEKKLRNNIKRIYFLGSIEFPLNFIKNSTKYFIGSNYKTEELKNIAHEAGVEVQIIQRESKFKRSDYQNINDLPEFVLQTVKTFSAKKIVTPFYSPSMVEHFMKKNVLKSLKAYIVRIIEHNPVTLRLWLAYNKFKKKVRRFFRKSPTGIKIKRLLRRQ